MAIANPDVLVGYDNAMTVAPPAQPLFRPKRGSTNGGNINGLAAGVYRPALSP